MPHQKWCIISMMTPFKKVPARFFATDSGEDPVCTWLKELNQDDRKIIGKDIQKVGFGLPIELPVCQSLGHGIWEVRSRLPGGRVARVIFGFVEGSMVLLHGFIKKIQKTPDQDKGLALKRLRSLGKE